LIERIYQLEKKTYKFMWVCFELFSKCWAIHTSEEKGC